MATKDHCLHLKDKQVLVPDEMVTGQFKDLNLNQSHQSFHAKNLHVATNYTKENPSSLDFSHSNNPQKSSISLPKKFCKNYLSENLNVHGSDSEIKKNENSNKNSSTLSLHIAAYENSVDAISSDLNVGENDEMNKNKEKCLTKKLKNVKQLPLGLSSAVNDLFEFPRQQPQHISNPEVMQFKASQQLLNVNQATSSNNIGHQNVIINVNPPRLQGIPIFQNHFHQLQHPSTILLPPPAKRSREDQNFIPTNQRSLFGSGMFMPRLRLPTIRMILNHRQQQPLQVPVRNQAPVVLPIAENSSLIKSDHPVADQQLQHLHPVADGQLQPLVINRVFLLRNHIGYKILSNGGTMEQVKAAVSVKVPVKSENAKQKYQRLQMKNLNASFEEDDMKGMNITYDVNEIVNKELVFPICHDQPFDRNQYAHESGTQTFNCYFCGKSFSNWKLLKLHLTLTYTSYTFTFSSNTIKISLTASIWEARPRVGETQKLFKNRYVPSKPSKIYHPKKAENYTFSPQMDMSVASAAGLYVHEPTSTFLKLFVLGDDQEDMEEKIHMFYKLWNTFIAKPRLFGMLGMYNTLIEFIRKTYDQIQDGELGHVWNVFVLWFKTKRIITEKQFITLSCYKPTVQNNL